MIGVCNLDEGVRSLTIVFAKQVGDSVFRDNVVGMGASSHHTSARFELKGNLGLSSACGRWHGQNGFTEAIQSFGSTTQEINLTTETLKKVKKDSVYEWKVSGWHAYLSILEYRLSRHTLDQEYRLQCKS